MRKLGFKMRLPNTLFVYDIRKYIFRCTKFMLKVCLFISCRIKPASLKVETDPNRTWAWARNLESHLQNTTTPCQQKKLESLYYGNNYLNSSPNSKSKFFHQNPLFLNYTLHLGSIDQLALFIYPSQS